MEKATLEQLHLKVTVAVISLCHSRYVGMGISLMDIPEFDFNEQTLHHLA